MRKFIERSFGAMTERIFRSRSWEAPHICDKESFAYILSRLI